MLARTLSLLLVASAAVACRGKASAEATPMPTQTASVAVEVSQELSPRVQRRFRALTPSASAASAVVDLGRVLYYDARLSLSEAVSCNSCHPLAEYGTTQDAKSHGIDGQMGSRNAPTTYNAAGHFRQFWDGREGTVEEQAKRPLVNPIEMGMTEASLVAKLRSIAGYRELFARAFPAERDPITFDNVAKALGAFERGLVTPSRWDRYLQGDASALSAREKAGAKLFANLGCVVCHTGEHLGGSMFEKVGVHAPWPNQEDRGRGAVTGTSADDMMFKVPTLRNVRRTAPYFHDGSARTIEEAIRMMGRHQLGEELDAQEIRSIADWFEALTGDIPHRYIARPVLPGEART